MRGATGLSGAAGDFKSALQEMLQAGGAGRPQYRAIERERGRTMRGESSGWRSGWMGNRATRWGRRKVLTKKQAQQEAARLAVARLSQAASPAQSQVRGGVRGEAAHG